jgi:hypothetical protein
VDQNHDRQKTRHKASVKAQSINYEAVLKILEAQASCSHGNCGLVGSKRNDGVERDLLRAR